MPNAHIDDSFAEDLLDLVRAHTIDNAPPYSVIVQNPPHAINPPTVTIDFVIDPSVRVHRLIHRVERDCVVDRVRIFNRANVLLLVNYLGHPMALRAGEAYAFDFTLQWSAT